MSGLIRFLVILSSNIRFKGDFKLKLSSLYFIGNPIKHVFPPIYEGLGLFELSNFIENRISFNFSIGEKEYSGFGEIRKNLNNGEMYILLPKIKGIGPVKEQQLKNLLLNSAKEGFLNAIERNDQIGMVYHRDFKLK
jgi:hypothetical protein